MRWIGLTTIGAGIIVARSLHRCLMCGALILVFNLDFLYAVSLCCPTELYRRQAGQIMCEAMDFLPRGYQVISLILGCGVPLGPAFGKLFTVGSDAMWDVNWDAAPKEKLLHRERVIDKEYAFGKHDFSAELLSLRQTEVSILWTGRSIETVWSAARMIISRLSAEQKEMAAAVIGQWSFCADPCFLPSDGCGD